MQREGLMLVSSWKTRGWIQLQYRNGLVDLCLVLAGEDKNGRTSVCAESCPCLTLEQVAQGGRGCPIPGGIQGQAGCGSGQFGLVVGDPAHSRGIETR